MHKAEDGCELQSESHCECRRPPLYAPRFNRSTITDARKSPLCDEATPHRIIGVCTLTLLSNGVYNCAVSAIKVVALLKVAKVPAFGGDFVFVPCLSIAIALIGAFAVPF